MKLPVWGKLPFFAVLVLSLGAWLPVHGANDDFTLSDLSGKQHRLSDYRGKWVLVNYWATWCPPCLEELPELEVFHSGSQGRAMVLGVNMEAIERDELARFVDDQFLSYPILVASEQPDPAQLLGPVDGLPTSYLVAPSGEIVARQVGPITADAIEGFIQRFEAKQQGGS